MFKNTSIGILLFITHLLACVSVGIIFRSWKRTSSTLASNKNLFNNQKKQSVHLYNLGEILSESITNSISTILLIGGFIVIFSSIISILNATGILNYISNIFVPLFNFLNIDFNFIKPLLSGILEITTGINNISNIACKKLSINIIFTAFLLGFGGISILLQVWSITSKTDLSIKPYLYGKILHGLLAAVYTYIFINIFPFFNFDL